MKNFSYYESNYDTTLRIDTLAVKVADYKISANLTLTENKKVLQRLEELSTEIDAEMPVSEQDAFKKWHSKQVDYFYYLYPTKYDSRKEMKGWTTLYKSIYMKRGSKVYSVCFAYPKRQEKDIIKVWRAYDSQTLICGNIVDEKIKFTNEEGCAGQIVYYLEKADHPVYATNQPDLGDCPYSVTTIIECYHPDGKGFSVLYKVAEVPEIGIELIVD